MSTRKIVAGLLMSLDGVVEAPNVWGWGRYFNDELREAISNGLEEADAVLLGRRTYLEFAALWPTQSSEVLMADFLNLSPKYVVSSTLRGPLTWNNSTLLTGDLRTEIGRLKRMPGKNILIPGSPSLVRWMLGEGLVDELSLSMCPIVVGKGLRLFDGPGRQVELRLARSTELKTGVLSVMYQPASARVDEQPQSFPAAAAR